MPPPSSISAPPAAAHPVTFDDFDHAITPDTAIDVPGNAEHGVGTDPGGLNFSWDFADRSFTGIT